MEDTGRRGKSDESVTVCRRGQNDIERKGINYSFLVLRMDKVGHESKRAGKCQNLEKAKKDNFSKASEKE
jgi:hypothetical protein